MSDSASRTSVSITSTDMPGVVLERVGVHPLGAGSVRRLVVAAAGTARTSTRTLLRDRARVGAALGARFPRTRAADSRGRGGADAGHRGSGSDQYDDFSTGSSAGDSQPRRRREPTPLAVRLMRFRDPAGSIASGSMSSVMTGISPVSSATVTASELPRRRRRRAGAGAPIVPFLASNSATEIGRVVSCGSVICVVSRWSRAFRSARWLPASRTEVSTKAVPSASLSSLRKNEAFP